MRAFNERRVRIYQLPAGDSSGTPPSSLISKLYDDATIIVWACGYESNTIPITHTHTVDGVTGSRKIVLAQNHGQVTVDSLGRLSEALAPPPAAGAVAGAGVVPNLTGCGLGFGLSAVLENGTTDGSTGRADGVSAYLKRTATVVLSTVVRDKSSVFGPGAVSWEERLSTMRGLVHEAAAEIKRKREDDKARDKEAVVEAARRSRQQREEKVPFHHTIPLLHSSTPQLTL